MEATVMLEMMTSGTERTRRIDSKSPTAINTHAHAPSKTMAPYGVPYLG